MVTEINPSEYWLVRDPNNYIWGPISRKEIIDLIRAKKLRSKAEISQSNSYWFQVDEYRELAKFFPELSEDINQPTSAITKKIDGEWLSEEFAAEFGFPIEEPSTPAASQAVQGTTDSIAVNIEQDEEPTLVPEESNTDPTLNMGESLERIRSERNRRKIFILTTILIIIVLFGWAAMEFFLQKNKLNFLKELISGKQNEDRPVSAALSHLKIALLLNDISQAQQEILALEKKKEASIELDIAKALIRKNFLFDSMSAVKPLLLLKKNTTVTPSEQVEIDNLIGIYLLDTDIISAIQSIQNAIKGKPEDSLLKLNLAIAYLWQGNLSEAEKILFSIKGKMDSSDYSSALLQLALGLANSKNAEDHLSQSLQMNPMLNEARILLSLHQWKSGKIKDAEKNLVLFINNLPAFRESPYIRNFRLADFSPIYSSARLEIRSLMSKGNVNELWLTIDGILSVLVGELKEAEQAFDRALQLQPGSVKALTGIAFMRLKEGREVEIEALLKDKSIQQSKNLSLQLLLAQSYLKQGKYIEAEELFLQLEKVYKDLSVLWSSMGEVYALMNKKQQASDAFKKALQIDNRDISAQRGLQQIEGNNKLSTEMIQKLLPF